jgi:hypothetical protein
MSAAEAKLLHREAVSHNIFAPHACFGYFKQTRTRTLKEQEYEEKLFWRRNFRARSFFVGA